MMVDMTSARARRATGCTATPCTAGGRSAHSGSRSRHHRGAGFNALDQLENELQARKQTPLPPFMPRFHDPDFQRYFGAAKAKLSMAQAAMYRAGRTCTWSCASAAADKGIPFSYGDDHQFVGADRAGGLHLRLGGDGGRTSGAPPARARPATASGSSGCTATWRWSTDTQHELRDLWFREFGQMAPRAAQTGGQPARESRSWAPRSRPTARSSSRVSWFTDEAGARHFASRFSLSSRSRAALRSSIGTKVSIARLAAVTSSGAPMVAMTVKRLTSPTGVRRSRETTGWVASPQADRREDRRPSRQVPGRGVGVRRSPRR